MPPVVTKQNPVAAKKPGPKPAADDVLSRLGPIQNIEDHGIKMAIYGRSGTGKTTLWSTFPKPICAAICSGAGETKSIKNVQGIDAVALRTDEELIQLINHVAKSGKYKTFVVDHGTGYQELALCKVCGFDKAPAQMAWGTATQQQWGEIGSLIKNRFQAALDLPTNTVLIFQERAFNTKEDDPTGILQPTVNVGMTPSTAGWVGPAVDYHVQTFIRMKEVVVKQTIGGIETEVTDREPEFCLRTAPHPVYMTKFRIPRGSYLPEIIPDPTYDKLLVAMEGKWVKPKK